MWLPPNADPVVGIDDVMILFRECFAAVPFTYMHIGRIEIAVVESGDVVSAWGAFERQIETPECGSVEPVTFLMAWKNRVGRWKVSANMLGSTAPLPENG